MITKTISSFTDQTAWNGEVRALYRAKKLPFGQMTKKQTTRLNVTSTPITHKICVTIQNVTGYKSRSAPILCLATLPDELNTCYAHFELFTKDYVVKFTPPSEGRPLSVTTGCEKNPSEYRADRSTEDALYTVLNSVFKKTLKITTTATSNAVWVQSINQSIFICITPICSKWFCICFCWRTNRLQSSFIPQAVKLN